MVAQVSLYYYEYFETQYVVFICNIGLFRRQNVYFLVNIPVKYKG